MLKTAVTALLAGIVSALGMYWAIEGRLVEIPATAYLPNGMVYTGNIVDGRFEGPGELAGAGKERYVGNFVAGRLEGEGEYWDEAGNHYAGEFVAGTQTGKGTVHYIDGSVYTGDFVAGELNGEGELQYADGRTYKGGFAKSLFNGQGKYHQSDDVWYEGIFKDGSIVEGKSVTSYSTYEGPFKDWLFHGEGVYKLDNGTEYRGTFEDGILSGKGIIIHSEGSRYEGEIDDWLAKGQGVKTEANGDKYTGEFEYDTYHGEGTLVLAEPVNGHKVIAGHWEWGSMENDPRDPPPFDRSKTEALLYNQNTLLTSALEQVAQGQPGKLELFSIGVAGYGTQDVFLKEISTVQTVMDEQAYSPGRSAYLINHYDVAATYPLATITSLKTLLQGFAQKMNVDEDILFLYLTSHGSKEHEFSIRLQGLRLPGIRPSDLAAALEHSGIRWRVVAVSACYAGGFIPALQNDNTMVMTAAREDRRSFGCGDDDDMTYFGEALFKHGLLQAHSFEEAFTIAKEKILEWENERQAEKPHSEPQLFMGPAIAKHLKMWRSSKP